MNTSSTTPQADPLSSTPRRSLGALAVRRPGPCDRPRPARRVGGGADGGCHYTDKDGYDIPIDDGQGVIVDGKTVTCQRWNDHRQRGAQSRRRPQGSDRERSQPQKLPVLNRSAIAVDPLNPEVVSRPVTRSAGGGPDWRYCQAGVTQVVMSA